MPTHTGIKTRAAAVWMTLAITASIGGIVRELWLRPAIGELRAHQLGTAAVCGVFLVIIAAFVVRSRLSVGQASLIGLTWLTGAVAFEFGFGHWVDRLPWTALLADYDLSRGRVLLLVWLTVAVAPVAIASYAARRRQAGESTMVAEAHSAGGRGSVHRGRR